MEGLTKRELERFVVTSEKLITLQSVIINSNGDGREQNTSLPWLLTEQQSNIVKEVIRKIRFPTGFSSNIQNILTKKGDFGGVKTHDWHTFIKVISRL
jgi:hypothetical protein